MGLITDSAYTYYSSSSDYGNYAYTSLSDIVTNFELAYVGEDKLIPKARRTDILFHAKRGMQEFSYDLLKSVKSIELTIPPSLSLALPQDYVNYVKLSWVDSIGVKHVIYPTTLTSSPSSSPLQDDDYDIVTSSTGNIVEGTPVIETNWKNAKTFDDKVNRELFGAFETSHEFEGGRYGIDPQNSQSNGTFTINEHSGTVSFSSDLADSIVLIEYISDGLAYDADTKVPKMAEEAMYAHILHGIVSTKANQPEYLVRRLKQEKRAKIRNTKIRLASIKISEMTQVMRNKSKQIKH
jgi:hypothetical protein